MNGMIEFYADHKAMTWIIVTFLTVAGCLVHYFRFGPHIGSGERGQKEVLIQRFGVREWISHWLMMIGFAVLAVTGFVQVIPGADPAPIGPFHGWLGFVFFIVAVITLLGWLPHGLFRSYDIEWLRAMGGYLSEAPRPLPAGRFNAGQKMYYWLLLAVVIGLLVSALIMEEGSHTPTGRMALYWCIHGLLGLVATVMVIGHGYLSLFANPATARVLWSGKVSKAYTDEYHAMWQAVPSDTKAGRTL